MGLPARETRNETLRYMACKSAAPAADVGAHSERDKSRALSPVPQAKGGRETPGFF